MLLIITSFINAKNAFSDVYPSKPAQLTSWTPRHGFASEQLEDPDTVSTENEKSLDEIYDKYVDKRTTSDSVLENAEGIQKMMMHSRNMSEFPDDDKITAFSNDRNSLVLESNEIIRTLQDKIPHNGPAKPEDFSKILYYLSSSFDDHEEIEAIATEFTSKNIYRNIEAIQKYVDVLSRNPINDPFYVNQAREYVSLLKNAYTTIKDLGPQIQKEGLNKLSKAFEKFFLYKKHFMKLTVNSTVPMN